MLPLLTVVRWGKGDKRTEKEQARENKETVSKSKVADKSANVRSHPALHVSFKFFIKLSNN